MVRNSRRRSLVESLEPRALLTTVAWSNGPALPAPRTDAVAVVTSDDAIRVVGGDSVATTNAPVLAAGASNWSLGFGIDTSRNDLGAASTGSSVYLFGGTGNTEGSDEVLNYDYRTGDSDDLAKMNLIRYDHGFAVDAARHVYALGGIGVYEDSEIWAESERYDPISDSWTPIASLPQALRGHSAIGDGSGHIFVFGGSTTLNDSGIERTSYRYDIATDSWSTIAPLPIGTRDSAAAMDDNGNIYVLGGMTVGGATDAVQQYDPTTNAWTSQTALPAPTYSLAAAYGPGGKLFAIGGFDAAGNPTDAVYVSQNLNIPDVVPTISTSPDTSASLDTFYTYDVNASGNPAPTYSLVTAPAGMTIDENTGLISWQPMEGHVGVHSVVVEASNRAGADQQAFDVTVVSDTIAPTTPANFTFESATESSVTFSWEASTDASGIDQYEIATAVYTGPRFGKRWVYTVVDSFPATDTTGTVAGLSPLEGHNYAVRAVDGSGLVSSWSTRVSATTLAAPTLSFRFGTQTTGTIQTREQTPITFQLVSQANPAPTFELVSGPVTIDVDRTTGVVNWTPDTPDVGAQTATFRATNSIASTDLTIDFDILPDTPTLTVQFNPTTGESFATAGTLFTAQVIDSSSFPSTFELLANPAGMTLDSGTGLISWTPTADQGGVNTVTVRGTNAGGSTDFTFGIVTAFTGAVTNVVVTGETTQLSPTVTWSAPTGPGADLVASYNIRAYTRYHYGSHTYSFRTHIVDYVADVGSESIDLTGLLTGKSYTITVTPVNAAGLLGVPNDTATVTTAPELPVVQWTVNGAAGPAGVVAGKPLEIVLTDQTFDPSEMELINGPTGLTFDPVTNTANWTPTAADVNVGYATTDVLFRVTNSVGPVDVAVPIHVYFSGSVHNAVAMRNGYTASASWNPPTDNVTAVAAYSITRHWTFAGSHKASANYTVPGDTTSFAFGLSPTGAVNHTGITITPVDEFGNLGISTQKIAFGSYQNDLPPIANDDTFDVSEDTQLVVSSMDGVRANDIDTDNTPGASVLTCYLVSGPTNGTLTLGSDGSVDYTPDPDFNGTDTFLYRVHDGKFYSDNATVTINVHPVNDSPAALDDYYTLDQETLLTVVGDSGVLQNDLDADGDEIVASLITSPAHGSVSLSADGSFTYLPSHGFTGLDTFTYLASDSLADSRIATVNLDVQETVPVNVAPTVAISGASSGVPFQKRILTLTAFDSAPADRAAGFTFDIDWDGDDLMDQTVFGPSGIQVRHAYQSIGPKTVKVTARDQHGAASVAATQPISIVRVEMQGSDLVWGGTSGEDSVEFTETTAQTVAVRTKLLNNAPVNHVQTFSSVAGQVIAFSGDGDDVIDAGGVNGLINIGATLVGGLGDDTINGGDAADTIRGDAEDDSLQGRDLIDGGGGDDLIFGDGAEGAADTIMGGTGNDTIYGDNGDISADGAEGNDLIYGNQGDDSLFGGKGKDTIFGGDGDDMIDGQADHDVLSGGAGNDSLIGAAGRDLLFAGVGADTLQGNEGDDLLVAGSTSYEFNYSDLKRIRKEWWSFSSYTTRVSNLTNTASGANNGIFLQPHVTVFDDGEIDTLFGQEESDWFLYNASGTTSDILADLDAGEVETDIAP